HTPHEAGAVEAAGEELAEEHLRLLRRSGENVRRADEAERSGEDEPLPVGELRQRERVGPGTDVTDLGVIERAVPGDAVRRLLAGRGVGSLELEVVVRLEVVDP